MLIQEFYSNMHGFNYSVSHFITRVRGTRIVVTSEIVSDVLRVPRVEHPDYPGCDRLRTISKDKLISAFCERPSDWGKHQFTYCFGFAKGPQFFNMVITFAPHPLSHYNSITKPHARFLLSLLEGLTIYFPSHFILSIMDVYKDSATRDKLIFPSAITRLLCHFDVPFPSSDPFPVMGATDAGTVKSSEAQLRSRQSGSIATMTPSAPSTSNPSSSVGGVTLVAIMAQLQHMDAPLDTLTDELCQVNTCVGHIARRQARLGGFVESPSPPHEAYPRTMMNPTTMMMMRMEMLALPALTRCLLDTLTLCHS